MNKKMRDIMASIKSKTEEARTKKEAGDVEAATELLGEIETLKADYELEEKLFKAEQLEVPEDENHGEKKDSDAEKSFIGYIRGEKAASAGMSQGANGAIVPKSIAKKIVEEIVNTSPIVEKATKYYTKGTLSIPVYGTDTSADSPTGDVAAAYQGDEFTALTAGQGKFSSVDLTGYAIGALSILSNKLINNTDIDVLGFIEGEMVKAFRVMLENELINGTSGKMTGAVSTTNVLELTTKTLAGITMDTLIELQLMVPQIYQPNCIWIMNKETFGAIRKLKNSDNNYYLTRDLASGFGWTLLNAPVYISDAVDAATKASGFPVLYGDFSGMALKIAKELEIQVLSEKYADKNAKGVVAWMEPDSKVENNQKIAIITSAAS